MNRLGQVDPAAATGQAKEIFDGPLKGKHFNIFKSMAQSPAALQVYLGMSGPLSQGLPIAAAPRVIQLAIGQALSLLTTRPFRQPSPGATAYVSLPHAQYSK